MIVLRPPALSVHDLCMRDSGWLVRDVREACA